MLIYEVDILLLITTEWGRPPGRGDLPHHLTAVTRWTGMDEETVVIVAVFSDNVGDAEEDTLIFFFLVLFRTSVLFLITNDGDLLLLVLDVLHGGFAGDASAPDSLPLFLGFCLSLPPTEVGGLRPWSHQESHSLQQVHWMIPPSGFQPNGVNKSVCT